LISTITSSLFYINSAVGDFIWSDNFIFIRILGHFLCISIGFETISSTSQTRICKKYLEKNNSYSTQ
jgi:hypothetical protein